MSAFVWIVPYSVSVVVEPASSLAVMVCVQCRDMARRRGDVALALGVAHGHDRLSGLSRGGVADRHRRQPGRVLQLDQGDVTGLVVANDPRRIGLARRGHGRGDLGGVLDDVVVRQHQPVGVDHHAGSGGHLAVVLERGVDEHQARLDLVDDVLLAAGQRGIRGSRGRHRAASGQRTARRRGEEQQDNGDREPGRQHPHDGVRQPTAAASSSGGAAHSRCLPASESL